MFTFLGCKLPLSVWQVAHGEACSDKTIKNVNLFPVTPCFFFFGALGAGRYASRLTRSTPSPAGSPIAIKEWSHILFGRLMFF